MREENVVQRTLFLEEAMADLREANAQLIQANLRSQGLADEMRQLLAEATASLEAKNDFFTQVSHELRTPLTSISGWASLLGIHPDPPTVVEAARSIASSAAMQGKLINDLLDASRIVRGRFPVEIAVIDLCEVLKESATAMRPLARAKQITFTATHPASVMVNGDPIRLRQVIDNLVSNSLKFTPVGGQVETTLTVVEADAVLRVRDTGIGIYAAFLPRVFDQHAQAITSYGGLGLGLAIVKYIMELHEGSVTAASEGEGKGSTFTLCIPLQTPI